MVNIKKLRWGGNMAINVVCRYEIHLSPNKKWLVRSPTFMWAPDVEYNSPKVAKTACQRHYESIIRDLLEINDDAGIHPPAGSGHSGA